MDIREASINDVPDLVLLMEQLGYPTSIDKFKIRLKTITANLNYHTLVAEMDGKIVGMAGLCTGLFYEYDGSYVQIVAFVVDIDYRRKGIGKKLIKEVECWAKNQGAITVSINSGNRKEREAAHHFYTSMGYEAKSIGFNKSLI
ncbi:histone acetyltransferase HPA2 [Gracilibacillus halophilus YIM-C55.5]|uniref:Histone acetyltransferase HPA2 n=1 Tax=Gracilibacillus halophilus YIM-C55.5 TaxID=1308866 RepID=N4WIT5_9BACI|nr:GNAT family N-acetyltransferase [Gracilibacillus halophilus]ENH96047.1 histone acetyltransferase HPA2 [Gracilibacillus halophilus YIM-C55.5]